VEEKRIKGPGPDLYQTGLHACKSGAELHNRTGEGFKASVTQADNGHFNFI